MALAPAQARKRWSVSCAYAVGAFDHVSRRAMLAGLQQCRSLQPLLPYVRQFYASDSTYVWQDAQGNSHEVQQSEGGEQGDPLMPALYAIAQHFAIVEVNTQLREGEAVFAYLDDIYVVAAPERIRELQDACQRAPHEHAHIELNRGKTRIWNAAGEEPANISDLRGYSEEPVWTGDWALPRDRQGLVVLGTPLGTDEYVPEPGPRAEPALHELPADVRWHEAPERSRMPSRAA
eukprot:s895_g11.t1